MNESGTQKKKNIEMSEKNSKILPEIVLIVNLLIFRFGMPGYSEHSNGLTVPPVHYPPNVYMNGLYPTSTASQNIISLTNASPTFQNAEDVEEASPPKLSTDDPVLTSSPLDMPIKLPPNWSKARDPRGYVYFYDKQLRISQWEPPQWTDEQILAEAVKSVDADDESSSESSETDSDNGDDEDDDEEEEVEDDEPEMVNLFSYLVCSYNFNPSRL